MGVQTVPEEVTQIVGESPGLKRVLAQVDAVAGTDVTVLIHGESGVGKELVAHKCYELSLRALRPLVKVNCASIPNELFESEFFGHLRGSFTGAHRDRVGRFQLADRGTLVMDEVAEIPIELQGKLLRVLQEGEFERVGSESTQSVDVRIIASSNRDLRREVEEGRFREDLYYRLSVFPIEVPPLRERAEDLVPLATYFLNAARQRYSPGASYQLDRQQVEALHGYDWPGNVRELKNVIERSVICSPNGTLQLSLRRDRAPGEGYVGQLEPAAPGNGFVTAEELREFQRRNIIAALRFANWRVSGDGGAADLLGLKASTLSYQIKTLGIKRPA